MTISKFIKRVKNIVERRNGQVVAVSVALTILAGMIYSFYLGNKLRFLPDEQDYLTIATHLAQQGIYSLDGRTPTAFRPPGYPLILSGLQLVNAGVVAARSLNYIFLGISIYIFYLILIEHASPFAATIGAGLVIAYPVLFYTAGTLYPQTLAALLFLLALYFLTRQRRSRFDYVAGGLLLGYLALTVPTFIVTVGVFVAWLFLDANYKLTRGALLVLVLAFGVVGIWTARNYAAFRSFVFVSTNSGENLLIGNSENSTPNAGRTLDISRYESEAQSLDEVARDKYFRQAALEYIRTHKARVVKLYFLKVLNTFNFRNELVTAEEGSSLRDLVMLLTYGPLLILFLLRLLSLPRIPPSNFEVLIITLYLANALLSAIFFTRIRLRLPFDYLLILNSALMIDRLINFFVAERYV